MDWDDGKVSANIQKADTDELLDRITAYRSGMEPEAIALITRVLHQRGVSAAVIAARVEEYEKTCLFLPDGTAVMCSFCRKPAVAEGWRWHKLWGMMPLFPRRARWCKNHNE